MKAMEVIIGESWREIGETGSSDPFLENYVSIGFFRNTGTDPLEKRLKSLGPIASRGRFLWLYVKYVDALKKTC